MCEEVGTKRKRRTDFVRGLRVSSIHTTDVSFSSSSQKSLFRSLVLLLCLSSSRDSLVASVDVIFGIRISHVSFLKERVKADVGDRESEDPASLSPQLHNALVDGVCMHGILSFRLRLILISFPSPHNHPHHPPRKKKKAL